MNSSDLDSDLTNLSVFARAMLEADKPGREEFFDRVNQMGNTYKDKPFQTALRRYHNQIIGLLDEIQEDGKPARVAIRAEERAMLALREGASHLLGEAEVDGLADAEDDRMFLRNAQRQELALRDGLLQHGITSKPAPIITRMPMDRQKLHNAGIPFANFAGYVVLTNQTVFGVGQTFVQAMLERETEAVLDGDTGSQEIKRIQRTRTADSFSAAQMKAYDALYASVLRSFLSRNRNLDVLGENGYAWRGARWYWVMEKSLIPRLRACAFGGTEKGLANWGFAFESRQFPAKR